LATEIQRIPAALLMEDEMRLNHTNYLFWIVPVLTVLFFLAASAEAQQRRVERTDAPYTAPTDGPGMYRTYCAVCHGVRGEGDGPAAPAMKTAVTNLTQLTKNNKGKFPEDRVYNSIAGDFNLPAHGAQDMPTWGFVFKRISGSTDEREAVIRLKTLTNYIKTMQAR
jgi:mono/diheme cytochrome c family protein